MYLIKKTTLKKEYKPINNKLNLEITIKSLKKIDIILFNKEREVLNSNEYKEIEKVTYKNKLLRDSLKPIREVKKQLNYDRDLIELDLFI